MNIYISIVIFILLFVIHKLYETFYQSVETCIFKPRGETLLDCIDQCKINTFSNCDLSNCSNICQSCNNKLACKWLDTLLDKNITIDGITKIGKPITDLSIDKFNNKLIWSYTNQNPTVINDLQGVIIHYVDNNVSTRKVNIKFLNKDELINYFIDEKTIHYNLNNLNVNVNDNLSFYIYNIYSDGISEISNIASE